MKLKTMICKVDGEFIMVLIRGHHELNDVKLKAILVQTKLKWQTKMRLLILWEHPGSLGPIHDKDIKIYADNFVQDLNNFVIGANEDGYHFENAQLDRDFKVDEFGDFRFILEGEPLSDGSGNAIR